MQGNALYIRASTLTNDYKCACLHDEYNNDVVFEINMIIVLK